MSEAVRKVIIKKVKKKHGEGHHGGSWKVAYADFVTAMMAFFLLLWLLSMVSTEKRAVMAEYFKNFSLFKESGKTFQPGSAFVITDHIKKAELKPENVAMSLRKAIRGKGAGQQGAQGKAQGQGQGQEEALMEHVRIDAVDGGVRIQIIDKEGSPMFQLGSAEPTEKAREILAAVAEVIKDQDAKIAIEGHTDAAPFRGDQITNWELSTNRASSARRMLESSGLDPARVARVVGYADTDLLVKESPKDPQNRRISIILLQPKDGGMALTGSKKEVRGSVQPQMPAASPAQQAPAVQPPPQAQPAPTPSAEVLDKEQSARQALEEKKAAMKKKKRDVMGLWD
jgi:chemotaxis protein MotB